VTDASATDDSGGDRLWQQNGCTRGGIIACPHHLSRLPPSVTHLLSTGEGRSGSHTYIIGIYRQGRPLPTVGKSTSQSLTSKWDKITDHHTSVYIFQGRAADKCRRHTAHSLLSPASGLPVISSRSSRSLAESAVNYLSTLSR